MAIGSTQNVFTAGGTYSSGPSDGQYHVKVTDAQLGASSKGTPQMVLEFTVANDPNHPAKEGKKLTKKFITLGPADPTAADAAEKMEKIKGMMKRFLFDGFGMKWPESDKPQDPRDWVGKSVWVQVAKVAGRDGPRADIVAIAQTQEGLPVVKGGAAPANNGNNGSTPAKGGRRR